MMSVSSSEAVRKMIGTFEVWRILVQMSKPEPSGRDTSRITMSKRLSVHVVSASAAVRATVIS